MILAKRCPLRSFSNASRLTEYGRPLVDLLLILVYHLIVSLFYSPRICSSSSAYRELLLGCCLFRERKCYLERVSNLWGPIKKHPPPSKTCLKSKTHDNSTRASDNIETGLFLSPRRLFISLHRSFPPFVLLLPDNFPTWICNKSINVANNANDHHSRVFRTINIFTCFSCFSNNFRQFCLHTYVISLNCLIFT